MRVEGAAAQNRQRTGPARLESQETSSEAPITTLDDFGGLLDWPKLNAWIEGQDIPGSGPFTGVSMITGGLANNVFMVERGREKFILRRPPKHLRPNSNDTMLREARVLRALDGTDVPHPHFYAACDDPAVIGACFYLMAPLEGMAPLGKLKGQYGTDQAWRRGMGPATRLSCLSSGSIP